MDDLYWIWFSRIKGLGSIKKQKLLEKYKTPEEIWKCKKEELLQVKLINEDTANQILKQEYRKNLEKYKKYMEQNEIKIISFYDENYPQKLKNIYDKPITLYVKGNEKILNEFSLAIIGCRENTKYGEIVTKQIASELAKKRITTVSGLARGIDSISQEETINQKGKTIAVLGNSLDTIYPSENKQLAQKIIETGGAIVSEYIIGTKIEKMNFPARNRIISGLSDGIIVVEAKKKSGTMITVDFGLEQGKNIFAVPGNITNRNAEGTNELIKQGAKLITNVEDILEEYDSKKYTKIK